MYLTLLTLKLINLNKLHQKKTQKQICIVKFDSKVLEATQLPKIFNHPDIIKTLPCNLQNKDSIHTVTYNIGNSIRWGEWPSGSSYCNENRKVPGSNPNRHSAGLWDLTSF